MVEEIGQRLGLSRLPEVLMVSARLAPMVWSPAGRPRLVLPAALFARLESAAQEAIVAHELAHIRRRDHLVRLLELTITTLFWWHPVVWWACRELRELEEHCCDGLVLGAVPHGGRAYATALVDTLDYLSERSMALPPVATGANSLISLSRRIKMLRHPASVRPLTVGRLLLLLAVAAVPMALAFAARTTPTDDRSRSGDPESARSPGTQDDYKGTSPPAAAKTAGTGNSARDQRMEAYHKRTWRIALNLQVPSLVPPAVQYAIFDQDPLPAFTARIKAMRISYRDRLGQAKNEAAREEERQALMGKQWDRGFKDIPGNRLYLLKSGEKGAHESGRPDGKKWIVTRVEQIKGKPVCWCLPVEVKTGKEIQATLTEENVFDLGAAFDSGLQEAGAATEGNRKIEDVKDRSGRITLDLRVPGSPPSIVQWALFDKDPVPGVKARMERMRPYYRERLEQAENQAAKDTIRRSGMLVQWNSGFEAIPGDRLSLLTSGGPHTFSWSVPDGKKWIVTRVGQIKGKSLCWCLPVELKTGEETRAILTEKNAFDLGAAFDSVLRETKASTEEGKQFEEWWRKTWRISLDLWAPGLEPPALQWAIFDHDPVPGFKSQSQKLKAVYQERWKRAENETAKERERNSEMTAIWDLGFREIKGNDLYLLTSSGVTGLSSNGPDGKKWLVTKVVQLKGKPVCWCIPVEVKTGKEIKVTLTEKNVFDLRSRVRQRPARNGCLDQGVDSPELAVRP